MSAPVYASHLFQSPSGQRPGQWGPSLTSTATQVVSDNATEIPEARLTAVTLKASHAWSAGALPCGWVTGATVGAMWVALAGACKKRQ